MEQRKCMICGAELGEREKYCGSCGAKAPDGAVEKEEIEPKYITKEKPHEPWMDYSWKAHNYFLKQGWQKNILGKIWTYSNFSFVLSRYYIYLIVVLILVYNEIVLDLENINFFVLVELFVHFLFCFYCLLVENVYKLCDNLLKLKKNAPAMLYIHCGIRIIVFPAYAIFLAIIDRFHPIIGWLALFEGLAGLTALIISIKYYEKRKKVFIN